MATNTGAATGGGGGSAAIGIRQPTQQQSIQVLLLLPSLTGVGRSDRSWWQIAPSGLIVASAAARAAPKLASRLDSATT